MSFIAYKSTKTYTPECGFACSFRQWRAESHCRFLHGYALGFRFTFACHELDERGWVVDFGGLKNLKGWLEDTFDHTCLVAEDDPLMDDLSVLANHGLMQLRVLPKVGCEAFAELVFEYTEQWLKDAGFGPRCYLESVEVFEHGGNSAIAANMNKS